MKYLFIYDHLPAELQAIAKPFADLAAPYLKSYNPNDKLTRDLLMKLWEAKNLAVAMAARPEAALWQ